MGFKSFILSVFVGVLALDASAQPRSYDLDVERSEIAFSASLLGTETRATAPVARAEVSIDFARIERSDLDVSVDASRTRTRLAWVAEALKSSDFLDTNRYPEVRFVASDFALNTPGDINSGATVTGDMIIRGLSRPVTLQARLFRQQGSAAGDLSNISVLVTGTVDRTRWGMNAFPGALGRDISLRILARISARP